MIYNNICSAWDNLVTYISELGNKVSPRGIETLEVNNIAYEYKTNDLQYTFNNPIRKANPVYHIVELFYYLNGRNDGLRGNYIKNAEDYVNPLNNRHDGSYGPAFYNGLPNVIMQLQKDPDTRRAVISTLRVDHIQNPDSKDVPCNDLFGWRIRDDSLDMNVVTRSQDLYIGWIYNTLGFQLLHRMLAKALSLEVGVYGHYIFSLHLYKNNVDKALQSVGETLEDKSKPEIVDYSPMKLFDTIRLMNSVLEFPALHGSQVSDFNDDLVRAIKLYTGYGHSKLTSGLYSRWVENWLK